MLSASFRLQKRRDFGCVYRKGKAKATSAFVFYRLRRRGGGVRIGFSASKKLGNAVTRNRIKRVFRHIVQEQLENFPLSSDYIFVIRNGALELTFQQLSQQISNMLSKES